MRQGGLPAPGLALFLALFLAACGGGTRHTAAWDGRRGYDGNGDYGYDLAASRAEARDYRMRAGRAYRVPGTPEDPWGPHIHEAATRFGVPEPWIREVMRQESGGRLHDADGLLVTSRAGAMGLMQVMPRTYDMLRARHGLGGDPYEPRDNILAGAAYIREMHDRYGAPGFLAAYNAGPDRVDAVLAGITVLPDETENYLTSVAPRLGLTRTIGGPFASYVRGGSSAMGGRVRGEADDLAYAGGGMTGEVYFDSTRRGDGAADPSFRAFDGGGLVTPDAPTGVLNAVRR
jgi:hypothetical protein